MILTGTLHQTEKEWVVRHQTHPMSTNVFEWQETPLVSKDQDRITSSPEPMEGVKVKFKQIDEFTDPEYYENVGWGDGIKLAKLTI